MSDERFRAWCQRCSTFNDVLEAERDEASEPRGNPLAVIVGGKLDCDHGARFVTSSRQWASWLQRRRRSRS